MLHQEECRVPFIVAHGPRSIEFELRMQISGLITIRFGASKDTDNTVAAESMI
uniref:Uncharacterized protein n=1 Tax=Wuchereria bancrofti TaxID=6293 RepID=A0AAF5Q799_WUCBA